MADPPDLSAVPVSPSRGGRHQIKRSITEFASPKSHLTRHSISHHNHHHHPFHHAPLSYSHHRREKTVDFGSQTAHPTLSRHSMDNPWRLDPSSQDQSRGGSQLLHREKDDESRSNSSRAAVQAMKEEKLREEKDKASVRADGLRQSLGDLHTFSTNASRRLDETYYAVLEKSSALQHTVNALRDLAETSREIYGTFEKDAGSLESEITSQIDAFGQFDEQQGRIQGLQDRIKGGRSKIQTLSERVDSVQRRVESWERADKEWQERTRRRLRVIWTGMFVIILVLVALLAAFRYASVDDIDLEDFPAPVHSKHSNQSATVPSENQGGGEGANGSFLRTQPVEAEDRLRGFDEL